MCRWYFKNDRFLMCDIVTVVPSFGYRYPPSNGLIIRDKLYVVYACTRRQTNAHTYAPRDAHAQTDIQRDHRDRFVHIWNCVSPHSTSTRDLQWGIPFDLAVGGAWKLWCGFWLHPKHMFPHALTKSLLIMCPYLAYQYIHVRTYIFFCVPINSIMIMLMT